MYFFPFTRHASWRKISYASWLPLFLNEGDERERERVRRFSSAFCPVDLGCRKLPFVDTPTLLFTAAPCSVFRQVSLLLLLFILSLLPRGFTRMSGGRAKTASRKNYAGSRPGVLKSPANIDIPFL